MKLSEHFMLHEFTRSDTARLYRIANQPSPAQIVNLVRLCDYCLEKVRAYFNAPVIITSGYRSEELNKWVGSKKGSQHLTGHACDFYVKGEHLIDVFYWCVENLEFDQIIYEFLGGRKQWIHLSYNHYNNRKIVLEFDGKRYKHLKN